MVRDFFGDLYIVMIYAEIAMLWVLSIYLLRYIFKKKGFTQIAGNFALAISIFRPSKKCKEYYHDNFQSCYDGSIKEFLWTKTHDIWSLKEKGYFIERAQ